MPYTKTVWDENTAITPARLNNLETQYEKAMADAVTEAKQEIQYYVSTSGNDNNAGTSGSPFKTIQKAIDMAGKAIAGRVIINIGIGTYAENLTIENVLCSEIVFSGANRNTTIIDGYVSVENAPSVYFYRLKIRNGTYGIGGSNGFGKLRLNMVTIENAGTMGIDVQYVPMVVIKSSSIDAGGSAVRARTVGNLVIDGLEISGVKSVGIEISSGTFASTRGLTGNIGSLPVHSVHGSILVKGASTITGGADTKSNGGQIFE